MTKPDEHDEIGFSIDMSVRNEWRNVDLLRMSVQNCFTAVFADVDGCHTIAMVTGELLENALKYGDWGGGDSAMFRLRVNGGHSNIVKVSVQNPLNADDANGQALHAAIEWINSFPSADAAYRARLMQIAQAEEELPSRLGLVRVAFEGNCRLQARIENGTAIVTATLDLSNA
jgi:hypothetical protein